MKYTPAPHLDELGDGFFDLGTRPVFEDPTLRFRNDRWAKRVGLDGVDEAEWVRHFARFHPLPDNFEAPHVMRYHGHQFRSYNPDLGDGRGFTIAQLRDDEGRLLDLGTKGSGVTPFSRGGDGRLTLKGGVREVLATEMLEALGVNTSKSFSLVETAEALQRHDEPSPTRSAVLVRLSHGHIRIGSFQRHAFHRDTARLEELLFWSAKHYHPGTEHEGDVRATALDFLAAVSAAVGRTCAQWMVAGFVHGVLNTDNINISGESFDYGPWRFLPTYDPDFTAAYFDHSGLYAYGRQPGACVWNLERLADAFRLFDLSDEDLSMALTPFVDEFERELERRVCWRLGVRPKGGGEDRALVEPVFDFLLASKVPFDAFFLDWMGGISAQESAINGARSGFYDGAAFASLRQALRKYEPTLSAAHEFELPDVSMVIDEVERVWANIAVADDWTAFHEKVESLRALGALLATSVE